MRRKLCLALFLALVTALPLAAQVKQIVVINKYGLAGVAMTADGNLWTAAQPTLNYASALIAVRKTGSVAVCSLALLTGPTAATATAAINDANTTIDCSAAVNKVVINLDKFLQGTVSSWSGTGTITIYVTLTNGTGWNLNATLSGVTQSTGSGAAGTYWYVRHTNGTQSLPSMDAAARAGYVTVTNGTQSLPSMDAAARAGYVTVTNGTQNLPSGDAQARGISTIPGNGTNADKQMLDGVGALGAGVKQVATLGTLSAAVASASMTQVVAVNAGARVLLGVIIETATNAAGIVTVSTGTGTNCGTGTATKVVFGIGTATSPLPVGYYPVNALVAAGSAICLTTDASTTSARVLTQ
jgi:hypothetical protein